MPGSGSGQSRRSHTKSRKGCKTCKRRHIRCDEHFPQCNNCTKHQVRCDYMDTVGSDTEGQSSPEQQHSLTFSPHTEQRIDVWQQTGSFPYPELQIQPPLQAQEYSKDELRLIHHISSISNDLMSKGAANLTVWAHSVPQFLSIAASYPYVMHALLSFSANHLSWAQSSPETKRLNIQHGTIALRGLHEAIGGFSHENSDAVLAASLLLLWQATDWRSWSSLRGGVHTVLTAMQSWKQQSIFAELVDNVAFDPPPFSPSTVSQVDRLDRDMTIQNTMHALQRLQASLVGNDSESYWIDQLLAYLQQLQSSQPAQSLDVQFSQLYLLRKWVFWVPVLLLQGQGGQGPAMLTTAHFYATALALEPVFPEIGPSFCARVAWAPLQAIIDVTTAMQSEHALDQSSIEIASLMQFPQQMAMSYSSRLVQGQQERLPQEPSFLHLHSDILDYTSVGNLSPAFAPSSLHYSPPQQRVSARSSFLEVPTGAAGFSYGTQNWGAVPSPGFPPQEYTQEDMIYDYDSMPPLGTFHGGFVHSTPIWT